MEAKAVQSVGVGCGFDERRGRGDHGDHQDESGECGPVGRMGGETEVKQRDSECAFITTLLPALVCNVC